MEKFTSGAVRSSRMPRYDLIPAVALRRLAKRFTGEIITRVPLTIIPGTDQIPNNEATGGALKYGECNWEKGLPTSDVINHIYDHLSNYVDNFRNALKDYNGDMTLVRERLMNFSYKEDDDLAGAMWGLVVLMHQETTRMYHDDNFTVFAKKERPIDIVNEQAIAQGINPHYSELEDVKVHNIELKALAEKAYLRIQELELELRYLYGEETNRVSPSPTINLGDPSRRKMRVVDPKVRGKIPPPEHLDMGGRDFTDVIEKSIKEIKRRKGKITPRQHKRMIKKARKR